MVSALYWSHLKHVGFASMPRDFASDIKYAIFIVPPHAA